MDTYLIIPSLSMRIVGLSSRISSDEAFRSSPPTSFGRTSTLREMSRRAETRHEAVKYTQEATRVLGPEKMLRNTQGCLHICPEPEPERCRQL